MMTFWEHLDELRKALTYPLITLLALTVVMFILKEPVFEIILAANSSGFVTYNVLPVSGITDSSGVLLNLISTELTAQILMHMKVSFYVALVLTIPFFFFKLFRFAAPALYENERKYSAYILFFSFLAFFSGIIINYFIIFPFSFRFMAAYQVSSQVQNMITLTSYINTLVSLSILMGICFELPVISWVLSKLGILKAHTLKKYRRHSIVGILVVAAIITPTTDIFTLLLVSVPILVLYELSIIIVKLTTHKEMNPATDFETKIT